MSKQREIRTLFLVMALACVPALVTVLAIVTTSQPDLSDLDPLPQPAGAPVVLNWSELSRERPHAMNASPSLTSGSPVQTLGYMMDGDRPVHSGDWVQSFILLPEAGNLLQPAHRFGDQMIKVHLATGGGIQFSPRRLVWVCGTLGSSRGDPAGPNPLYVLEQAGARPASSTDIRRYFK